MSRSWVVLMCSIIGCATVAPPQRVQELRRVSTLQFDRDGVVICRFQADGGIMTCSDPKNAYRMAFSVLEQRELDRMLEPEEQ